MDYLEAESWGSEEEHQAGVRVLRGTFVSYFRYVCDNSVLFMLVCF